MQGEQEKWDKADKNTLEGGSEVDSYLIQSILISKKSLKNVIQSLSKLGHSYSACMDCLKARKQRVSNCCLRWGERDRYWTSTGFCNEMNAFSMVISDLRKRGKRWKDEGCWWQVVVWNGENKGPLRNSRTQRLLVKSSSATLLPSVEKSDLVMISELKVATQKQDFSALILESAYLHGFRKDEE